jgi:hypothetical protein
MEKAHPSPATLPDLQTDNSMPKRSMSVMASFKQLT